MDSCNTELCNLWNAFKNIGMDKLFICTYLQQNNIWINQPPESYYLYREYIWGGGTSKNGKKKVKKNLMA